MYKPPCKHQCGVVATIYNDVSKLVPFIESIYRSAKNSGIDNFPLIIVDDGSDENLRELAYSTGYPVKYIKQHSGSKYMLAAARNRGVEMLKECDRIVFVDSDVVVSNNWFAWHSNGAANEVRIGPRQFTTKLTYDETEEELYTKITQRDSRNMRAYPPHDFHGAWGGNVSVPTKLVIDINGLDEEFRGWGGEDADFALRLVRSGCIIAGDPSAAIFHPEHPSRSADTSGTTLYNSVKAKDVTIVRNTDRFNWKKESEVELRIVQCIQCANEKQFIRENVLHIYNEVDAIIVIPGMVEGRDDSTPDGLPTDGTVDILRDIKENHDPEDKITVHTIGRKFKSLEELKDEFIQFLYMGDWMLITDADEFYFPEDIQRLRTYIERYPEADEFIPIFITLYANEKYILKPGNVTHQRILKFKPGTTYKRNHPTANDYLGRDTVFHSFYRDTRYIIPDLYIYHYGELRSVEDRIKKHTFYRRAIDDLKVEDAEGAGRYDGDAGYWVRANQNEILSFSGPHPLKNKIQPPHPEFEQDVPSWKEHPWYGFKKEIPQITGLPEKGWTYNTIPDLMYLYEEE